MQETPSKGINTIFSLYDSVRTNFHVSAILMKEINLCRFWRIHNMGITSSNMVSLGSKMTLNYQVMVEGYPNLKEEVGGSNPGCEISSLLDGKLARW